MESPLDELDGAIERCEDAKSLIGLLMLRELTPETGRSCGAPLHRGRDAPAGAEVLGMATIAPASRGCEDAARPSASRRSSSTSSPTWSSSAGSRATRSRPTAPTCSSSAASSPSASATPPTRSASDLADFLADLATGRRERPAALLAGDGPPQGGLPALLLPAPAPRGADRGRPGRRAGDAASRQEAPAGPELRRGAAAARSAAGRRAGDAARPGAARGHVRVRAAGLGDDRARDRRRRPASTGSSAPAGKGSKERLVPARPQGDRRGRASTCGPGGPSWSARTTSASCSSTSAAAR